MANLEEVLRNCTAKIVNSKTGENGTCVIFKKDNNWYALTAAHCVFGQDFRYKESITMDDLKIKYGIDIKNNPDTLEVKEILIRNSNPDITVVKISSPSQINLNNGFKFYDFENSDIDLSKEIIHVWGYPKAYDSSEQPNHLKSEEFISSDNSKIEIKIEDDSIKGTKPENNTGGYSGSGMFIEKQDGIYLIGILTGYKSKEQDAHAAFYRAIGIRLSSHKSLLSKYINFVLPKRIKTENDSIEIPKFIIKSIKKPFFAKTEELQISLEEALVIKQKKSNQPFILEAIDYEQLKEEVTLLESKKSKDI